MSDWLKVFTFPPGAVVLLVNEHREQPDYSGFVIRSELRFRGRIIVQHHQQSSAEALERNFAVLDADLAAQWVINTAETLRKGACRHG